MKKSSVSSDLSRESSSSPDTCPSCGRFIGASDNCPYCGSDSARKSSFKVLRRLAIALAITGLVFLYMAAGGRKIPLVKIEDINPMMNFAYVRIEGEVDRDPYVARKNGMVDYVSFSVGDGTGFIRVAAYRDVAEELAEQGLIPEPVCRVKAAGNLSVDADRRPKLILRSAGRLKVFPGENGKDSDD